MTLASAGLFAVIQYGVLVQYISSPTITAVKVTTLAPLLFAALEDRGVCESISTCFGESLGL